LWPKKQHRDYANDTSLNGSYSESRQDFVAKVAKTFGLFSSQNETLGEFRYGL
jgi:hypothetical protein